MPVYCPICREIFKSPEARQRCDSHINERRCLRRESPAIEGLTEDEIKALSRLQLRDKGDPVRGYTKIWESIFPDSPAPKDPYVQAGGPEYVKLVTRRSLGDIQAVGTKAILHVLIQPTFTASSPAENAMRIAQHVLHAIDMLCDRISDDAFDEESDGENEPATTPDRNRSKSHLHVVDETLRVPMAEKRHRSESRKCSPRTNAPMSKGRVGTEKKYDAGSSVSAGEGIICSRGPRTVLNTFEDDTEERGDKGGVDGQEFDHLAAMEVDGRENGYSFSKTPSQEEVGIGGLTMGQMGQVLSEDMPYYDTSLSVNR
jgi:hypothetical protein